jgi:triacylglycerol lipase
VEFDTSRQALIEPGRVDQFFDHGYDNAIESATTEFRLTNALWLAEFSRLIYRQEEDENPQAGGATRHEILQRVGWQESHFINVGGTTCALLKPVDGGPKATVLVFRGTNAPDDWLVNLEALLTPWENGGSVHKGFKDALMLVWAELLPILNSSQGPLIFTGHSLGAAMATLAASLFTPSFLYTFGSPRVGNDLFVESLGTLPIYRVVNGRDGVCQLPLPMPCIGFKHAGRLFYITQSGELLSDAGQLAMIKDQWKWEMSEVGDERRRLFLDLPKFMTDHSPVNYIAQLQMLL